MEIQFFAYNREENETLSKYLNVASVCIESDIEIPVKVRDYLLDKRFKLPSTKSDIFLIRKEMENKHFELQKDVHYKEDSGDSETFHIFLDTLPVENTALKIIINTEYS